MLLLPLVSVVLGREPIAVTVTKPHAAQARLAEALADADSIDRITADHGAVVFAIDRAGEAYEIIARLHDGEVSTVTIRDRGLGRIGVGPLSWLVDAIADSDAITRLEVDAAGQVTLMTSAGERYKAIRDRGHGNTAIEARWAASWDDV